MTYTKENLLGKHGVKCTVSLIKKHCEGKITVEDGIVYICQNNQSGLDCKDKQGYKYSYAIVDSSGTLRPDWFNNLVLLEDFTLPEKWMVKITPENEEILEEWRTSQPRFLSRTKCRDFRNGHLLNIPSWDHSYIYSGTPPKGYENLELITFEQFKSHVLKQKDMSEKIVAWKIKETCRQYTEAVIKICPAITIDHFSEGSLNAKTLRELGLLSLWFEPIYGKKVIKILSYELKKETADYASFGCVRFNISRLKDLVPNLKNTIMSGDVKISGIYLSNGEKVSIELLQEIVDYTKN